MVNSIIDIKRQNLTRILELVKRSDGILKKEISDSLQVSMGTVSNLCGDLKTAELIYEVGDEDADATVGRQAKYVYMKKNSYYIITLDIHRSDNVRLFLADISGEIKAKKEITFDKDGPLEEFIANANKEARSLCSCNGIDWDRVIGVGAAVSAVFDTKTQLTICSGIEIFENVPLKAMMEREFGKPVFVDNDSNLCAAYMHAIHPDEQDIVYIFCSEGLGAGIITGGNVLTGASGYASEVCHIPIGRMEYKCELCGCGGCIQNDLSITGFLSKYKGRRIKTGSVETEKLWEEFLLCVQRDDEDAMAVIKENGELFGELTSILVNLLDPDSVYIGGDVSALSRHLLGPIEEEVHKRRIGAQRDIPMINFDQNRDTIVLGCSEQVFKNTLSVSELIKKRVRNAARL